MNEVSRFKKKVLTEIQESLVVLRNKDVVELHYPELNGLGLEKVNFISDGIGRMNATMRLEDLVDEQDE